MIEAFVIALVYCVVVMAIAWLITVLAGLVPMPPNVKNIVSTVIWVVAVLICLVILLRVVTGATP